MSELNEINGIVFGGKKYTVGGTGEVPEGLIDPMSIEWVVDGGWSGGSLEFISPVGIPVKLPDIDLEGNYITSISSYDFGDLAKLLTGVILPSHLVEVPASLFRDGQLEFVEFGDQITSIGSFAFQNNQITSVVFPDSLTSIDSYAFQNNQITSVVFGDSLTSIGNRAFYGNQITSVFIPDSVTSISDSAFNGNPLEEVSIHIDTTFSSNAFPSSAVITYRIPEGHIFGEGLTSIANNAYKGKGIQGNIDIADSVTSIGDWAFQNNQITSVDLPDSVTSIGDSAFEGNQLTSIVIPDSVTSIGYYAFNKNPLEEVSIGPNTAYVSSSFPSSTVITVREN